MIKATSFVVIGQITFNEQREGLMNQNTISKLKRVAPISLIVAILFAMRYGWTLFPTITLMLSVFVLSLGN